ncbi:MAG: hypothetical protein LAT83_16435 [Kiritimatiellae bacterium]|nr:hypothetical protein [Kiritimatiellia bacterium]
MKKSVEIPGPPPRMDTRVLELIPHAGGLFTLRLEKPDGFAFTPGDCVAVYGPDGKRTRPYSLAGGVGEPYLELLIRKIPGGLLSDWLSGQRVGASLCISPPFGWFRPGLPETARKIWFATGSGVAPFLSVLRSGGQTPVRFYWGVRSVLDLEGIWVPGAVPCVSRGEAGPGRSGRMTDDLQEVELEADIHYSLCGLDGMIEEVTAFLLGKGVPQERIHSEIFFTNQSPAR